MFTTLAAVAAISLAAPEWRDANAETSAIADPAGLDALAADFPNSATIQRRILIQAFQAGDRDRALAALERLKAMGYGLSDGAFGQISALIGEAEALRLQAAANWRWVPISSSGLVDRLADHVQLAEAVIYDPASDRTLVGSVVGRSFYAKHSTLWLEGRLAEAGSVFGMALDDDQRTIWLASGKVEQTPDAETAFIGLIAIDADSLEEKARYAAPDEAQSLNDIGLAPDGSLFAADATGGGIYRLAAGSGQVEQVIAPNRLRGPQGIAFSSDAKRAYLADYGYGIAMLDLETGRLERLEAGPDVMLDGVDGLYWSQGSLIAVQNGIRPMQITRLDLDATGTRVIQQVTLERANPDWGEPTLGQVVGDHFIYIADPQWDRFGEGGAIKGDEPLRPNQIRSIRIR